MYKLHDTYIYVQYEMKVTMYVCVIHMKRFLCTYLYLVEYN